MPRSTCVWTPEMVATSWSASIISSRPSRLKLARSINAVNF